MSFPVSGLRLSDSLALALVLSFILFSRVRIRVRVIEARVRVRVRVRVMFVGLVEPKKLSQNERRPGQSRPDLIYLTWTDQTRPD